MGFTWGDYDGENLRPRRNKGDKPLLLHCTAEMKAALDRAKASLQFAPTPNRHIITKEDGSRMADVMLKERRRLKLTPATCTPCCYRGVMELAWADCDDDEILSYSGHSTKARVIKYAGEARQIMRARRASAKRG